MTCTQIVVPTYDLRIYQGDTFVLSLTWKDSTGAVIDLTAYTARMHIRKKIASTTTLLELTEASEITLAATSPNIVVTMSAAQTVLTDLERSPGVYDIELTSGGVVSTVVKGNVILVREVSR